MNQIIERKEIENYLTSLITPIPLGINTNRDNLRTVSFSEFRTTVRLVKKFASMDSQTNQELSPEAVSKIQSLIEKIGAYLAKQNIDYKITQTITSDPEYQDFNRVKVGIKISKDLDFIFKILKKPIYDIINESIPLELEDKILIKLEKL